MNGLGGRLTVTGNGVPASQLISIPTPSSLLTPHPILMEPQETETKRLAVQCSLPEDRPALSWLLGWTRAKA